MRPRGSSRATAIARNGGARAGGKTLAKRDPSPSTIPETIRPASRTAKFQAYCLCGRRMAQTTPEDVRAGIPPRCEQCKEW